MKLYPHQERFKRDMKDKMMVVWEGGAGKTIAGCIWLRQGRDKDALVICPKRVVDKWKKALGDWGASATVLSKETFKKTQIKKWSAVVVDEADEFASPLFTKSRSQLSTALYELVKTHDMPILLATATPIRSNPWNLHTLLCFLGIYIDHKKWRERFFTLERRPFLRFPSWFPKPDWREKMRPLLEKYADIVLLKDCVDSLPSVVENVFKIKTKNKLELTELTPMARFVEEHRHEQVDKIDKILKIGKEYRKVLVVAHYVEQVESLNKELSKDRETFAVHGGTKNQERILDRANKVDECFLIIQASIGAGFDADSFSCVVFASMSYRVRDLVQMKYRVRRINNLHPVEYNYLIGGRCDKRVYDTIQLGKDFIPSEWEN